MVTVAREGGAAEQESSRACRNREQTGINGSSRGDAVGDTQHSQLERIREEAVAEASLLASSLIPSQNQAFQDSRDIESRGRAFNWKQRRGNK